MSNAKDFCASLRPTMPGSKTGSCCMLSGLSNLDRSIHRVMVKPQLISNRSESKSAFLNFSPVAG
jgi:hypothetical protein